jgi:hypothetical protein
MLQKFKHLELLCQEITENIKMKKCSKCGIEKLFSEFCKDTKHKDGLTSWCLDCSKESIQNRNHK